MFRYLDSWVVERTLFEFVNQGGCSCCGMTHGGMRAQDFMALCSDWETDDGKKEKKSPWPDFMRDEVWSERVKFRRSLKEGLPTYRERFVEGPETDAFFTWMRTRLSGKDRAQCFQMPREELNEFLNSSFKPAYQVVLCAVAEQITQFNETGYSNDGATDAEVAFEECLYVDRGAYVVEPDYYETEEGLELLFERFRELGGDHLLPKRDEDRRAAAADADAQEESKDTQSFRADRRLLRVVISRYYADLAWRKFKRAQSEAAAMAATAAAT